MKNLDWLIDKMEDEVSTMREYALMIRDEKGRKTPMEPNHLDATIRLQNRVVEILLRRIEE